MCFVDVGEIESARWELGDNVKLVNVTSFKFVNPLEGLTGETEILEGEDWKKSFWDNDMGQFRQNPLFQSKSRPHFLNDFPS